MSTNNVLYEVYLRFNLYDYFHVCTTFLFFPNI